MAKQSQGRPQQRRQGAAGGAGARRAGQATRARKRNNQFVLLWVIGGVVVVLIGVLLLNQQTLTGGSGKAPASGATTGGAIWGPEGAPVTIVEYSNFGCSHCKNFAVDAGKKLRQEYEATGKVRFEFRQFKLGDPSTTDAANASLCAADQNRFWDYHDLLFQRQGLSPSVFSKASLKEYGKQIGLNTATFNACVDGNQHATVVDQNSSEGTQRGVTGTPTFFLNGTMSVGEMPYDQLKAKVDAALQGKS